jgi:8-oxo-dGTP diphosphatase
VEVDLVGGLLYRQGRLLLGKRCDHRSSYPGVWDMPGGHVEAGETAEQALVRELSEELGVIPTAWRNVTTLRAPAQSAGSVNPLRLHIFLVTQWRGEPRNAQPDEHERIAWFTADELPHLALAHAGYVALLRTALATAS